MEAFHESQSESQLTFFKPVLCDQFLFANSLAYIR